MLIVGAGHMIIFYPKFHSELNFIENFWGSAKRYARKHCNFSGRQDVVPKAMYSVSLTSIRNYYQKSQRYTGCLPQRVVPDSIILYRLLIFGRPNIACHIEIWPKLADFQGPTSPTKIKFRKIGFHYLTALNIAQSIILYFQHFKERKLSIDQIGSIRNEYLAEPLKDMLMASIKCSAITTHISYSYYRFCNRIGSLYSCRLPYFQDVMGSSTSERSTLIRNSTLKLLSLQPT
ncbi:unnamed protein product [Albugo candida]|uniref:Uncharacterized protein n=1 Tax=Albugo candida TaxID=65357 RepID=A0A024GJ14_9STRA|nr:unnamed protein product [Albugo candida]|eukprot:CCI46334.1 unnamed protein product [Albugo candida]